MGSTVEPEAVAQKANSTKANPSSETSLTSTSTALDWVFECPGDWLWMLDLRPDNPKAYEVVLELYLLACYTLPTFYPYPLCAVINPEKRYCIDLLGLNNGDIVPVPRGSSAA